MPVHRIPQSVDKSQVTILVGEGGGASDTPPYSHKTPTDWKASVYLVITECTAVTFPAVYVFASSLYAPQRGCREGGGGRRGEEGRGGGKGGAMYSICKACI